MKELDFTFRDDCMDGILDPDQLNFFYYDIARDCRNSIQVVYEWNEDVKSFLEEKGINVEFVKSVNPERVKNSIKLTKSNDSKPEAFFRHLRNAFAHFHIVKWGEYVEFRDWCKNGDEKKCTMVGYVKYEDLRELCFIFFRQRDDKVQEIMSTEQMGECFD
jgi:hypothetical protein